MSRTLGLLFALCLLALPAAPAAIQAADPPRVEVKTGLRVVATIFYASGTPRGGGIERPAKGLAVKVFPEKGGKAVAEVKTDDKGVFVVALPAGKYRVEAVAFEENGPPRRQKVSAEVEVKEGAVSEVKLEFTYQCR
jgi:hypothetical protein